MSVLTEVLIILGLILANGFFAAAEIAILTRGAAVWRSGPAAGSRAAAIALGAGRRPQTLPPHGSGGHHPGEHAGCGVRRGHAGPVPVRETGGDPFRTGCRASGDDRHGRRGPRHRAGFAGDWRVGAEAGGIVPCRTSVALRGLSHAGIGDRGKARGVDYGRFDRGDPACSCESKVGRALPCRSRTSST